VPTRRRRFCNRPPEVDLIVSDIKMTRSIGRSGPGAPCRCAYPGLPMILASAAFWNRAGAS